MTVNTEGRVELFRCRVGSHNYNLNDENSDEDWKVFVLPTFDDLYNGLSYSSPTHVGEELDYSVKDIRFFGKQIWKANLTFLEVLYSDKIIINPELNDETKRLIESIFNMRDKLVVANLPNLYQACIGMHKQRIKAMSKGSVSTKYLVEKNGYCTKNAMHSYRYLSFIARFGLRGDFQKALRYNGFSRERMLDIKYNGIGTQEDMKNFLSKYCEMVEKDFKEQFMTACVNEDTIKELNSIIKEIVRINK